MNVSIRYGFSVQVLSQFQASHNLLEITSEKEECSAAQKRAARAESMTPRQSARRKGARSQSIWVSPPARICNEGWLSFHWFDFSTNFTVPPRSTMRD